MSHWSEALDRLEACEGAVDWARVQPDYATAWATCPRGDWMLWLLGRTDRSQPWSDERRPLVRCAAACAAGVLELTLAGATRDASESLLSVLQAWCEGAATRVEVARARRATGAAYTAVAAVVDVAADAYARAESASAAAAGAWPAPARARSLAASADTVRSRFPTGPVLS